MNLKKSGFGVTWWPSGYGSNVVTSVVCIQSQELVHGMGMAKKKMGRGEKTSLDSSVCHCRACILNRGDTVPKGAKIDSCQGWQGGRVGVCSKKLRCYMVYGFLKGHST